MRVAGWPFVRVLVSARLTRTEVRFLGREPEFRIAFTAARTLAALWNLTAHYLIFLRFDGPRLDGGRLCSLDYPSTGGTRLPGSSTHTDSPPGPTVRPNRSKPGRPWDAHQP